VRNSIIRGRGKDLSIVVINLFNFFRPYKSPPFHTVIRIHLISLSYYILVNLSSHFSSMEQMFMLMLVFFSWMFCNISSRYWAIDRSVSLISLLDQSPWSSPWSVSLISLLDQSPWSVSSISLLGRSPNKYNLPYRVGYRNKGSVQIPGNSSFSFRLQPQNNSTCYSGDNFSYMV